MPKVSGSILVLNLISINSCKQNNFLPTLSQSFLILSILSFLLKNSLLKHKYTHIQPKTISHQSQFDLGQDFWMPTHTCIWTSDYHKIIVDLLVQAGLLHTSLELAFITKRVSLTSLFQDSLCIKEVTKEWKHSHEHFHRQALFTVRIFMNTSI